MQMEQHEQASLLVTARAEVAAARLQAEELATARAALGAMEVHSLRTSDDLTATCAALAAAEARAAELRASAGGGAFHARGRRRFDTHASTAATQPTPQTTGAEAQAQAEVPEWGEVRRLQAALDEAARCVAAALTTTPPPRFSPLALALTLTLALIFSPCPCFCRCRRRRPHLDTVIRLLSRRVAELETAPRAAEPACSARARVSVPRLSSLRATPTIPTAPTPSAMPTAPSIGPSNTPSSARNGAASKRDAITPLGHLMASPGKLRSRGTPQGSPARTLEVHNWPKLAAPWRVPAELAGQD